MGKYKRVIFVIVAILLPVIISGGAGAQENPGGARATLVLTSGSVANQQFGTPRALGALLYDQTTGVNLNRSSQNFETANDAYDSQGADDFVVPAGGWEIGGVVAAGGYDLGGIPASVDVTFYTNLGALPDTPVCTYAGIALASYVDGDVTAELPSACSLTAGTYWVSVVINMDSKPHGQWYWHTISMQTNAEGVWRNPGNQFGTGCVDWSVLTSCGAPDKDFAFQLYAPVAAETATPTEEPPVETATVTEETPVETATATEEVPVETATATQEAPEATATEEVPEATATATEEPPVGTELIVNGGFENDLTPWVLKKGAGEKVKCNTDTKQIANSGDCAFKFKGGAGENSKIQQNVDLTSLTFAAGDTLDLSVFVNAKKANASGKVKVVVKYSDSEDRTKLTGAIATTVGYVELIDSDTLLSGEVSKIKVQIGNKSPKGKIFVDDVSLIQTAGNPALLPLP